MPRTKVYEAVTERLEILDTEGRVDPELMPEIDPSRIRDLYRDMVLMRTFDGKALKLQRQGRMGTWPPIKGQEAVQAGVALAMGENDWLIPAFREHGIMVYGTFVFGYDNDTAGAIVGALRSTSRAPIRRPGVRITNRSTRLRNSRTFPG